MDINITHTRSTASCTNALDVTLTSGSKKAYTVYYQSGSIGDESVTHPAGQTVTVDEDWTAIFAVAPEAWEYDPSINPKLYKSDTYADYNDDGSLEQLYCYVPDEALASPGQTLWTGLSTTVNTTITDSDGEEIHKDTAVYNTTFAKVGKILPGADPDKAMDTSSSNGSGSIGDVSEVIP